MLIKGKKIPESSRVLEARLSALEAKTDYRSNESLFANEKPEAKTEMIQPLTEKETAPDRAVQTLDGRSCQKWMVSPVC